MVDLASQVTLRNIRKDLEKLQLHSINQVLDAFEGQPIKLLGYFLVDICVER